MTSPADHESEVIFRYLRERKSFFLVFSIVAFATLLAKGAAVFQPSFSSDGYHLQYLLEQGRNIDPKFFLGQGRIGLSIIHWLRDLIGYSGADVSGSSIIIAIACWIFSGWMLARVIAPQITTIEQIIFGLVFSLHPFTTEMFTFSEATLNTNIAVMIGAAGLYVGIFDNERWRGLVIGGGLIFLSLTIYQLAINYCVIALGLGFASRIISESDTRSQSMQRLFLGCFALVLATVFYLIFVLAIGWMMHVVPEDRSNLSAIVHPDELVRNIWDGLVRTYAPTKSFIPRSISNLTAVLLVVSAIGLLKQAGRKARSSSWLTVLSLIFGALAGVGIGVVSSPAWLVPRVLSASACFVAGLILLGWRNSGVIARSALSVILICLLMGYVSVDNKILSDQRRIERWDFFKVNRIVARLETDPSFLQAKRLAVMQGFWSYPLALGTSQGDMNISSLWPGRSRLALFEQATGYWFQPPTSEQDKEADQFCNAAPKWPALGSTGIIGELAIVCLSNLP